MPGAILFFTPSFGIGLRDCGGALGRAGSGAGMHDAASRENVRPMRCAYGAFSAVIF